MLQVICYANGDGVERHETENSETIEIIAAAQCNLGVCYENGEGVVKDEVEAVRYFKLSNDSDAQYQLSVCYANGSGSRIMF